MPTRSTGLIEQTPRASCITIIRFSIPAVTYVLNPVKEDLLEPDKLIIIPSVIQSRPLCGTRRVETK